MNTQKGKNFHTSGLDKIISFWCRFLFRMGMVCRNANRKLENLSPMQTIAENPPSVSNRLQLILLVNEYLEYKNTMKPLKRLHSSPIPVFISIYDICYRKANSPPRYRFLLAFTTSATRKWILHQDIDFYGISIYDIYYRKADSPPRYQFLFVFTSTRKWIPIHHEKVPIQFWPL